QNRRDLPRDIPLDRIEVLRKDPSAAGIWFRLGREIRLMSLIEFGWRIGLYSEAQAGEVGFWHDLHDGLREKTKAFFSHFCQVLEMSLCEGSVTKLGHVGHYLSSRSKRRLGSRWMRTVMGGSRNVYSSEAIILSAASLILVSKGRGSKYKRKEAEGREVASIEEAYYQNKLQIYYNARSSRSSFKLGDFVLLFQDNKEGHNV
ncbi:hypothetical protein Tco_0632649, partial [Tanacetum coccineum]